MHVPTSAVMSAVSSPATELWRTSIVVHVLVSGGWDATSWQHNYSIMCSPACIASQHAACMRSPACAAACPVNYVGERKDAARWELKGLHPAPRTHLIYAPDLSQPRQHAVPMWEEENTFITGTKRLGQAAGLAVRNSIQELYIAMHMQLRWAVPIHQPTVKTSFWHT